MTDITKRLADALHIAVCNAVALMNRTPSREPSFHEAHSILRQALIDYADETAAQEANVRGNAPQFRAARSDDGPDDWTCELRYGNVLLLIDLDKDDAGVAIMRNGKFQAALPDAALHPTPAPPADKTTPQTSRTHDGKEFIDEQNAPLPEGKECLACNGTGRRTQVAFAPAPASEEVTDDDRYFLRQAGRILKTKPNLDALGNRLLSIETKFALSRPAESIHPTPAPASGEVTDAMVQVACEAFLSHREGPHSNVSRDAMRAALEAATRARQGEGIALEASRKAVAELIEAAEEYMVNSIPTSDHLRLKLALAAVTAHPNDAEGRT